jgi:hypothetical protein
VHPSPAPTAIAASRTLHAVVVPRRKFCGAPTKKYISRLNLPYSCFCSLASLLSLPPNPPALVVIDRLQITLLPPTTLSADQPLHRPTSPLTPPFIKMKIALPLAALLGASPVLGRDGWHNVWCAGAQASTGTKLCNDLYSFNGRAHFYEVRSPTVLMIYWDLGLRYIQDTRGGCCVSLTPVASPNQSWLEIYRSTCESFPDGGYKMNGGEEKNCDGRGVGTPP